jgi:hypothetical protein
VIANRLGRAQSKTVFYKHKTMKFFNRKRLRSEALIRRAVEDMVDRNGCQVLIPEADFKPVLFDALAELNRSKFGPKSQVGSEWRAEHRTPDFITLSPYEHTILQEMLPH